MSTVIPDFLGMSLDEINIKLQDMQLDTTLFFKNYLPEHYKCWGKDAIFTKRAIRQKLLKTGVLEILISDFIENP